MLGRWHFFVPPETCSTAPRNLRQHRFTKQEINGQLLELSDFFFEHPKLANNLRDAHSLARCRPRCTLHLPLVDDQLSQTPSSLRHIRLLSRCVHIYHIYEGTCIENGVF